MTKMPNAQYVSEIRLCQGVYQPCIADLPPVEVVCQAVNLNACSYAWVDGVDPDNPLLLPIQVLSKFRSLGTLRTYLEHEKHLSLGDEFTKVLDLCMARGESATILVRACEMMHAEGCAAEQAVVNAHQWGVLLNELDQAERASFQLVTSGTAVKQH